MQLSIVHSTEDKNLSILKTLFIYILTALIFLAIDSLWLGVLAKDLYATNLGPIIPLTLYLPGAIAFYLTYIGGILYFSLLPAIKVKSPEVALRKGAILGGLCYAVYDLTNLATIEGWPVNVVFYDLLWGIFITGSTSFLTFHIGRRLGLIL